jgi:hypothetical protein
MSDQRKLIFLHLPKTGGSSLVNILHQHYGLANSVLIAGDNDPSFRPSILQNKTFIHGHFSANLLDIIPDSYFKASLLRNATDRVISRFVHIAHSREPQLQQEYASYGSFDDFLESTFADNWQCRMLSGIWHSDKVDEEIYMRAVNKLHEFDWVATAADLPLAALDLSLKLGFTSYYQPKLNRRASGEMWQELNALYHPKIRDLNYFDELLVREAAGLFQQRKNIPWAKSLKLGLRGLRA